MQIGQSIKYEGTEGTITSVKEGLYTAILKDGTVIGGKPAEAFTPADSTLHEQISAVLALLARVRAEAEDAQKAVDVEMAIWRENNTDLLNRVTATKDALSAVDKAARVLVARTAVETGDTKPHTHAHIAMRDTVVIHAADENVVRWAISANRPDALKPFVSQINVLVKAGIAPAEVGTIEKLPVVNIDSDLNDLLTIAAPESDSETPDHTGE